MGMKNGVVEVVDRLKCLQINDCGRSIDIYFIHSLTLNRVCGYHPTLLCCNFVLVCLFFPFSRAVWSVYFFFCMIDIG